MECCIIFLSNTKVFVFDKFQSKKAVPLHCVLLFFVKNQHSQNPHWQVGLLNLLTKN
jgi:hypothetical protein